MLLKELLLLLVLVIFFQISSAARILCIASIPSYSHQLFYRPIWLELAKRGHNLTLLTTDPMENAPSNIKQIDLHFTYEIRHLKHNVTMKMQEHNFDYIKILDLLGVMLVDVVDNELSHPEVKALINNKEEHFDLVITELMPYIMSAFSVRFKCPYISIFSTEVGNYYYQALGNPLHPILYPEAFVPVKVDLSFKYRVLSTFYYVYLHLHQMFYQTMKQDLLVEKHFGRNYPPLREIVRNVSMVFDNSHPVFNARPVGPGVVRIAGGIHMKEKENPPEEIKTFLDNATEGAIYFSLGTNVRSQHISDNFLNTAIEVFKELPYKILWKLEKDIPNKPENVKILKWIPQQDVLRHKNVKLFITQCGAQSLEESILAEVPILGIPFVSDQKMNALKIVNRGIGVELDRNDFTKESFKDALLEVMYNERYYKRVKETAILLKDEPMSGLEKAIWWTEYVIRHKGAKHFWHPSMDLPLYQLLLLDVIAFVAIILFIIIYIIYITIKLCISLYISKGRKNKQKIM